MGWEVVFESYIMNPFYSMKGVVFCFGNAMVPMRGNSPIERLVFKGSVLNSRSTRM